MLAIGDYRVVNGVVLYVGLGWRLLSTEDQPTNQDLVRQSIRERYQVSVTLTPWKKVGELWLCDVIQRWTAKPKKKHEKV
jgi:hypothetical protein